MFIRNDKEMVLILLWVTQKMVYNVLWLARIEKFGSKSYICYISLRNYHRL